jgi:hypothetical protein
VRIGHPLRNIRTLRPGFTIRMVCLMMGRHFTALIDLGLLSGCAHHMWQMKYDDAVAASDRGNVALHRGTLVPQFLKRVLALEGSFGSADAIVLEIGRRLLAEHRVPTLIEL